MNEKIEAWLRTRDAARFKKDMNEAAASVRNVGKAAKMTNAEGRVMRATFSSVSDVLGLVRTGLKYTAIGLTAATAVAVGFGLAFDSSMEQSTIAFTHFLGSADKAHAYLDRLYDLAAKTPFQFGQLTIAARQLIAFGFSAKSAYNDLKVIGDVASGLGTGANGINAITRALGQMKTKGVLQGDELLQLQEAGVNAYKYLIQAGLITKDDIGQIGNMYLDSNSAIAAIIKGMKKDFGGLSAEQAKSFSGQLSTMKDYAKQAVGAISMPLFDLLRSNVLPSVNKELQKISKWARDGGMKEAMHDISAGFSGKTPSIRSLSNPFEKLGMDARVAYDLINRGIDKVTPPARDFWGIMKQTYGTIKDAAPYVAGVFVVAFYGLSTVLRIVNGDFDGLRTALIIGAAAFYGYRTAMVALVAVNAAVEIYGITSAVLLLVPAITSAKDAWVLLELAFGASAVGVVVAGIVLIGGAAYVLYQKWGWFHRAVNNTFDFFKQHWPEIAALMTGPFALATYAIIKNFDDIKNGVSSAIHFIADRVRDLISLFDRANDKLTLKVKVPGVGKIGLSPKTAFKSALKFTTGAFMPGLAGGGSILPGGQALVGEDAPEIAENRGGRTVITPLSTTPRPRTAALPVAAVGGKDSQRPIVAVVKLNGREIARAVAEDTDDRIARR